MNEMTTTEMSKVELVEIKPQQLRNSIKPF